MLSENDSCKDADFLSVSQSAFDSIIEAVDKEDIEGDRTVHEPCFDFILRDILNFSYNNHNYDIFNGHSIIDFLSGNLDIRKELNFKDGTIYVRPAELIKKDYEKAVDGFRMELKYDTGPIGPDVLDKLIKYGKRLERLGSY